MTADVNPDITIDPASFEVELLPDVTAGYDLTITNDGDGTLHYAIGESTPTGSSSEPAALALPEDSRPAIEAASAPVSDKNAQVDEIIVRLKDTAGVSSAQLNRSVGITSAVPDASGRFSLVQVPEGRTAAELIQDYLASGLVEYAEPNYARDAAWTPNDPLYPEQWNFDQVDADAAWDIQQGGSSAVVVAVLDSGIAYEDYGVYRLAPDLAETNFVAGLDYVNGDAHPNDDFGHGTHVCGTIAQSTNNGIGVAGLAFGVTIMPVKVLDSSGHGTSSTLADGIYYAVDHGAQIINLSLGGTGTSQTEADAIAYAANHNVIVVCAGGNDSSNGDELYYPAAYPSTIAVGATNYDRVRSAYSNTGSYIDLVAPGGDSSHGVLQQTFAGSNYGTFGYWAYYGTSMACPHVAATAALLLSENPTLTPDEIRAVLESTAVDLGAAGPDDVYGYGLLNAGAALAAIEGVPWLDESPTQGDVPSSSSVVIDVTVNTTGLTDGDYEATIVIASNDPDEDTVEVPFTLHVRTVTTPMVTTGAATGVEEQAATLHGTLVGDGSEACQYSFQYGTVEGGPYSETGWSGSIESGAGFSVDAVQPGPGHHVLLPRTGPKQRLHRLRR